MVKNGTQAPVINLDLSDQMLFQTKFSTKEVPNPWIERNKRAGALAYYIQDFAAKRLKELPKSPKDEKQFIERQTMEALADPERAEEIADEIARAEKRGADAYQAVLKKYATMFTDQDLEEHQKYVNERFNYYHRELKKYPEGERKKAARDIVHTDSLGVKSNPKYNYCQLATSGAHLWALDQAPNPVWGSIFPKRGLSLRTGRKAGEVISTGASPIGFEMYVEAHKDTAPHYAKKGDKNFNEVVNNIQPGSMLYILGWGESKQHAIIAVSGVDKNGKIKIRGCNKESNRTIDKSELLHVYNPSSAYREKAESLYTSALQDLIEKADTQIRTNGNEDVITSSLLGYPTKSKQEAKTEQPVASETPATVIEESAPIQIPEAESTQTKLKLMHDYIKPELTLPSTSLETVDILGNLKLDSPAVQKGETHEPTKRELLEQLIEGNLKTLEEMKAQNADPKQILKLQLQTSANINLLTREMFGVSTYQSDMKLAQQMNKIQKGELDPSNTDNFEYKPLVKNSKIKEEPTLNKMIERLNNAR